MGVLGHWEVKTVDIKEYRLGLGVFEAGSGYLLI